MSLAHRFTDETDEDYLPYYCDVRDEVVDAHPGYRFCPYCGAPLAPELVAALRES